MYKKRKLNPINTLNTKQNDKKTPLPEHKPKIGCTHTFNISKGFEFQICCPLVINSLPSTFS